MQKKTKAISSNSWENKDNLTLKNDRIRIRLRVSLLRIRVFLRIRKLSILKFTIVLEAEQKAEYHCFKICSGNDILIKTRLLINDAYKFNILGVRYPFN